MHNHHHHTPKNDNNVFDQDHHGYNDLINCVSIYHEDVTLGNWVAHQRRMYTNFLVGETTDLTLDKIRSLQGLGFCLTERDFW